MGISIRKIIDVQSGVLAPVVVRMNSGALLFSKTPLIDLDSVIEFTSYKDVLTYFAQTEPEAIFAEHYFAGYDENLIKPDSLKMFRRAIEKTPAILLGGDISGLAVGLLSAVTDGSMNITIDGTEKKLTGIDLTSIGSFSDVAAILSTELAALAEVQFIPLLNRFSIMSKTFGAASTITFASAATAGTDLSSLLSLTEATGAKVIKGSDQRDIAVEFALAKTIDSNFSTVALAYDAPNTEKVAFVKAVTDYNKENPRYIAAVNTTLPDALISGSTTTLAALVNTLEGAWPIYGTIAHVGFWLGLIGCMRPDSSTIITTALKTQSILMPSALGDAQFDALMKNGYNFYGPYDSKSNVFNVSYPGSIMGKYNYADAFFGAMWLTDMIENSMMLLLKAYGKISYTETGFSLVRAQLQSCVDAGIDNQVVEKGMELTQPQKVELLPIIGEGGIRSLEESGFWYSVENPKDLQDRLERKSPYVRLIYTYGGAIQQLKIYVTQVQ